MRAAQATLGDVFSFAALRRAAQRAARGKRGRPTVARFLLELEPRLFDLQARLLEGAWSPSPPLRVRVHDPKPRDICIPSFGDRVVHQALADVLGPRLERRLIGDCFASRAGLGTHAALRRFRAWARTYPWVVKLDVVRYFPSLDHELVLDDVARDVSEPWLLELLARIVAAHGERGALHFPNDDLFAPSARRVGLPLGSLVSQLLANRFLEPVDHHAKEALRIRGYLRYMDDMVVFGRSRDEVIDHGRTLEERCWGLRLRLHAWDALAARGGVSFVGYRVVEGQVRVRRTTVGRAERRLARMLAQAERGDRDAEEVWASLRSTFAHWDHADTWRLKGRLLRRLGLLWPDDDIARSDAT